MTPLPEDHSDLARMCGAIDYEDESPDRYKLLATTIIWALALGMAIAIGWLFFRWTGL